MTLNRKVLLKAIAIIVTAMPAASWAQATFPVKPITIVVASGAGGGTDILARIVADKMRDDLGQTVIVDNKAGAGGNIGAELVARAPKDGYTLLMTAGALAIAPSIYASLSYNPLKDLTGVSWLAIAPLIVVTKTTGPVKDIPDLVSLAKKNGGKISFASFGAGTPSHLAGESINQHAKVNMTHVPYNRGGAIIDIQAGDVTVGILDALSTIPYIKSGQLRALAVTGPKRFDAMPDVPTLAETGIPFTTVGFQGAFAPAGTPAPIIDRLNAAFTKALSQPGVAEKIVAGGSLPVVPAATAAEWNKQFLQDVESWSEIVKAANIKIE